MDTDTLVLFSVDEVWANGQLQLNFQTNHDARCWGRALGIRDSEPTEGISRVQDVVPKLWPKDLRARLTQDKWCLTQILSHLRSCLAHSTDPVS